MSITSEGKWLFVTAYHLNISSFGLIENLEHRGFSPMSLNLLKVTCRGEHWHYFFHHTYELFIVFIPNLLSSVFLGWKLKMQWFFTLVRNSQISIHLPKFSPQIPKFSWEFPSFPTFLCPTIESSNKIFWHCTIMTKLTVPSDWQTFAI